MLNTTVRPSTDVCYYGTTHTKLP